MDSNHRSHGQSARRNKELTALELKAVKSDRVLESVQKQLESTEEKLENSQKRNRELALDNDKKESELTEAR